MERHDANYALYGGTDVGSFSEYFRTRANDYEQIREEYKTGVEIACDRFQSIHETLAENSQFEITLAVFTSNHGEQLGEADDVAHSSPITPELAYVPTRFINQSLQPAEFEMNPDESIIEHVDVIRTVLEAAGIELGNHQPGINLLNECRTDEFGLTTVKNRMGTFDIYSADSILRRRGLRILFQQPGPTAGVCRLPELLGNRKPRNAAHPRVRRQPHLRSERVRSVSEDR
jgi:arylsulfatase A-like enzyme